MEKEIWKDIVGYEGMYQISNFGRVKSLQRTFIKSNNITCVVSGCILKLSQNRRGYTTADLSGGINIKKRKLTVHRLVALAFIGNKNNLPQVNHKDEDKNNNYYKNLGWVTNRANKNYSTNKKSTSRHPGVYFHKSSKQWMSRCRYNGKQHYLGRFNEEELAAQAYIDFCKQNNLKYSV